MRVERDQSFGKEIRGERSSNDRKRSGTEHVEWIICVLSLWIGLFAASTAGMPSQKEKEIQQEIASGILRFHVLANSDTPEDQAEKLRVRDSVMKELEPALAQSGSKKDTVELVKRKIPQIKKKAEEIVSPRSVQVSLTRDRFPEKTYGDCTFPEGEYEALRIEIGEAKGHNWWCVLYPGLCFREASRPVFTEEGEKMLEGILDETAYDFIMHPVRTKIRFRWFTNQIS